MLKKFGRCDFLVNNAGRSIRRGIASSYDRFHDFERTMQLNYFGSLRLIMGFLPSMVAQGGGHIINISSIGVLTRAPRFSAYVASKAALDAFSDCAASEFIDNNVNFTTINMPLVKTPMIAPTKLYNHVPTLTPEQAADLVVEAIVYKPVRIATRLGIFGEILHARGAEGDADHPQHGVPDVPGLAGAQRKKKDGEAAEGGRALARADGIRPDHAGHPLVATKERTMATPLKAGDPAPDFSAATTDGKKVSLKDFRGKKLVMYFYPMDDTPGCTKQACSLRDHNADIVAKGAAILGVSTQDEASHEKFTRKYKLNFPLLADTDGAVGRAYGTIGGPGLISKLKSAAGMADRVTFVIDEKGRIAHVLDKPDVAHHAEEVLALL